VKEKRGGLILRNTHMKGRIVHFMREERKEACKKLWGPRRRRLIQGESNSSNTCWRTYVGEVSAADNMLMRRGRVNSQSS